MKAIVGAVAVLTLGMAGTVVAQDANPVGEWEWVVDVDGQMFAGTMEITGEPGEMTGSLSSDMGVADILGVEVDGSIVVLTIDTGQGELLMELEFDGDEFTGFGSMQGMDFPISGARIG